MAGYTANREAFQRSMEDCLSGPAEGARSWADANTTSNFYHVFNGRRLEREPYVAGIAEWRGKSSDYTAEIHEFLRDGSQLAARMTGLITADGTKLFYESFMFGQVDKESGKMEWLVERSVYGPVGKEPDQGVN